MKYWLIGLCSMLLTTTAHAHWASPGYLELKQTAPETYAVLWKVPLQAGRPLELTPVLPQTCVAQTPTASYQAAAALVQRWVVRCDSDLNDKTIAIDGLSQTLTDVLVRVNQMDGTVQTIRLKGENASFTATASPGWADVSRTYLGLGIEHILAGIDHLLFVLALLIIVSGWRRLVATITAFTVAHSITLAAATLGWVRVPIQPVEAVIALSILFLAVEIVHRFQGRTGITESAPWLVSFVFGLLHGFGFASALADVGLPQNAIPLALLFFNIGVELGQLLFVGACLLLTRLWAGFALPRTRWLDAAAAYAIGSVAAYWTIERVASFWV